MPKIFILDDKKYIEYEEDKNLMDILLSENIFLDNACNGKGICGKCKIKIIDGDLEEISETEKNILKEEEIKNNIRLACLLKPKSNITIELLQRERKHRVLSSGYMPKFKFNPSIHKKLIILEKPTLENQRPLEDEILKQLKIDKLNWKLLKNINYKEKITAVFNNDKLIYLEEDDTTQKNYGVIIDIGTTTVVSSLIDINSGKELSVKSMINPQKQYGLDVLTRITYELENKEEGILNLQKAIVSDINKMIENMCKETNINKENIYEITVSGNCTMLHMFLGMDARSIGKSPFAPKFVKSKNILAKDINIDICKEGRIYCLPGVSSYIGADIVSGAYVCHLDKVKNNVLFIDIGTNGEIVLSNKGKLLCCSCAAGPALEGMNISCGMRAANGAIEDVVIDKEDNKLTVIGNENPVGICGSGILSVVKELLRTNIVKSNGAFIKLEDLNKESKNIDRQYIDLKESLFKVESKIERLKSNREDHINSLFEKYEITLDQAIEMKDDNLDVDKRYLENIRKEIRNLGNVNLDSIKEYEHIKERHDFYSEQKKDLEQSIEVIEKLIYELEENMKKEFESNFNKINENFKFVYKRLFGGGNGELKIVDKNNILESDIEITAQPPGKKMKNLNLLSGGEKALTAISILFSIILAKPTPFCILDEIEAPLDDANIFRFGEFLKELSNDTQFISVTHRRGTMEAADYIYGVTMQEKAISKVLSLKLKEAEEIIDAI